MNHVVLEQTTISISMGLWKSKFLEVVVVVVEESVGPKNRIDYNADYTEQIGTEGFLTPPNYSIESRGCMDFEKKIK